MTRSRPRAGCTYNVPVIAGVILAAGASSRMGRCKALLPAGDGRSFLARLTSTLADAGASPTVAVVGGNDAAIVRAVVQRDRLPIELVENPDPSRGQLSSLLVALTRLEGRRPEAALVIPVDLPLVAADTVRRIVDGWRQTRAPIVRPARRGRHGHPVLFDASVFPDLLAADPAVGARSVVRAHADRLLDVPTDDPGAFEDIDTPEDYRRVFGVGVPGTDA